MRSKIKNQGKKNALYLPRLKIRRKFKKMLYRCLVFSLDFCKGDEGKEEEEFKKERDAPRQFRCELKQRKRIDA